MARRRKSETSVKEKKTPTKVRPIPRKHAGKITEPWAIMERLIDEVEQFSPLKQAKIKLWWQKDWKADVDGVAIGAQVCKANEIDRNLAEESSGETVDLFVKLPEAQWPTLDETEKEHRLFHELCHIKPAMNSNGEQKRDTKDRLLWRLCKHPITAFFEELDRYGYDRVIGHNAEIVKSLSHAERPMEKVFDEAEKAAAGDSQPSESAGTDSAADPKAWRRWKTSILAEYGFPLGKLKLLENNCLGTMGKLMDAMSRQGGEDFWWKDIKGFGETGYDAMTSAIMELRKAKPEFQADVA